MLVNRYLVSLMVLGPALFMSVGAQQADPTDDTDGANPNANEICTTECAPLSDSSERCTANGASDEAAATCLCTASTLAAVDACKKCVAADGSSGTGSAADWLNSIAEACDTLSPNTTSSATNSTTSPEKNSTTSTTSHAANGAAGSKTSATPVPAGGSASPTSGAKPSSTSAPPHAGAASDFKKSILAAGLVGAAGLALLV